MKGYSTYYSAKLDAAIESNKTIDINIKNKIKSPTVGADGKMIKETGGATNVDKNAGGGVTYTVPDKDGHAPEAIIYISGNENKNIKDEKGKSLIDKPSDILAHELVGHAIPRVVGSDTGNAVENENKVRKQQGKGNDQKRAPEPKHVE